jgi:hypothetical protein
MGDNAAAVDERGEPLAWDQRGNGDPRFVAGVTDIGAFEVQAFPVLRVNMVEDSEMRSCTGTGVADCSLRGAITLANMMGKPAVISFDPKIFSTPRTITLTHPLPDVGVELILDAQKTGGVIVRGEPFVLRTTSSGKLTLRELKLESRR